MTSGAKSAVIILSVLGLAALVLVGGAVGLYYASHGKFSLSSLTGRALSEDSLPIVMHDDAALAQRHYVDHALACRIRLPAGPSNTKSNQIHTVDAEGDFVSSLTGRSIAVVRTDRGSNSFDTYVSRNRDGLTKSSDMSNVQFLQEGRCSIQGLSGYAFTISCQVQGISVHQRYVCLDAPNNKIFLLVATSKEENWDANKDALDSSLSTFELGIFAEDPPEPPGRLPNNPFANPGNPATPPRPTLHTTFTSAAEALTYLNTGQPMERRFALSFLEHAPADAAIHDKVLAAALPLLDDNTLRDSAARVVAAWAAPADAPTLRDTLIRLNRQDTDGNNMAATSARRTMIQLLAKFADADSVKAIAGCLPNPALRAEALQALQKLGAAAEDAVLELASSSDSGVVREALSALAKVGTEKSVLPLQRLSFGKDAGLASLANTTLQQLASRLQLKPDQYLNNLVLHYTIDAPAGFFVDAITTPNTRQWSHAASGRTVRSVYSVSVKLVPADYQLPIPPGNTYTLAAGKLTFHEISTTTTPTTRAVRFQALDGEYLLDLTATMDTADAPAGNTMTNAAKKIHAN